MKIKAIIIDDEHLARTLLRGLLTEFCPNVEIIAECPDLPTGVKAIRKLQPQLVFLDIEMPGHSGLEILDFFDEKEIHFSIVFTTAYHQYAIQAFKLSAIDYLLKPIEYQELIDTVQRFEKKLASAASANISTPREAIENAKSESPSKIAIPTSTGIRFVDLASIVSLKADNNYTEIALLNEPKLLISRTLKSFEEALANNSKFFRCHKSYIVNVDFITDYIKRDGGSLSLVGGLSVPISTEKVQEFLDSNLHIKR